MNPTQIRLVILLVVSSLALFGTTACASKKYVRKEVDARVTPVEGRTGELEETSRNLSNRTTDLEGTTTTMKGQISDLNTGVNDAKSRADNAMTAANNVNARVDTVDTTINNRINSLDTYTLQDTKTVLFKLGSAKLSDDDTATLDQLATAIKGTTGYVIEIEGFADSTGRSQVNQRLSEARAKAVYQYLAEHDVPIYKMQIVGLGTARPVADNTTRDGRKENRRVEVRLMNNTGLNNKGLTATSPNPNPDDEK